MTDLVQHYLPILIFLGVSLAIGAALLAAPFLIAVRNPDPKRSRPTNAASTRSMTRA